MNTSKNSFTLPSPKRRDGFPSLLHNPHTTHPNRAGVAPLKSAFANPDRLKSPLSITISSAKPRLEPLLSPKDNPRKKLGISVQISPKHDTSMGTSTLVSSPRNPLELSGFMAGLYKKPIEKSEDNAKSFISFRAIALNNSNVNGSVDKIPENSRSDTPFLPPMEPDSWRTQLELNKKREGLFQQTIQGIFNESNQNFYKMLKQKERQTKKMPHIRVYTSVANSFRPDQNKTPVPNNPNDPNQKEPSKTPSSREGADYSSRVRMAKDEPYKFYHQPATDVSITLRKPHAREGATMTTVGKNIYLYGGISREVYNEWEVLDTTSFTWTKLEVSGDTPPNGRFGHVAERYLNSIVIFGGEKHYNSTLKIRECLSDVRIFLPEKNEWKYIKAHGDFVEPRRNHAGVIVGKHLLIHGGIDTTGLYLNDLMAFNLVTCRWSTVQEHGGDNLRVAFHRACAVLSPMRKDVNLFKMPDVKFEENIQSIKEEGIYFFGGRTQEEEPLNTLKILKIGNQVLKWKTAITQGKTPDSRFLHSMSHCRKLNLLIVHGGRCDGDLTNPWYQNNPFLFDFNVLQLDNLTWVRVITNGSPMQDARCAHSAAVIGSKLVILGGLRHNTYCAPDHEIYEMDQAVARNLEKKLEHKTLVTKDPTQTEEWNEMKKHYHRRTTMVSFLPVPLNENSPKKIRQKSRKDAKNNELDHSMEEY